MKKKILFLSGTRADFGKMKSLINAVKSSEDYEYQIFGTGMHMMARYGSTIVEVEKSGFSNLFTYINQVSGDEMEIILANTIAGLSRYLHENKIDLLVVHGDRVEALAGATVGALRNIRVAHLEGGEVSGTVDELIRHAVTKLSHIHFVATQSAQKRLLQLGESSESVFLIGSPDVDAMFSDGLPSLVEAKERYGIKFDDYSLAILHPVTTEYEIQQKNAEIFVNSLLNSKANYILVYPNNDSGSEFIFQEYRKLEGNPRFRIFPSLRFEHFLTFLRNAKCLVGNSSAGIHEAPIYGVPTINIGTRQQNRFRYESIFDVSFVENAILTKLSMFQKMTRFEPCTRYGDGTSAVKFMKALESVWSIPQQKQFKDMVELANV